jgi:hypothetical protein
LSQIGLNTRPFLPLAHRPLIAAAYGAFAIHLSTATFALFAGIDVNGLEWPRLATAGVGFVAGYLGYRYVMYKHRTETRSPQE